MGERRAEKVPTGGQRGTISRGLLALIGLGAAAAVIAVLAVDRSRDSTPALSLPDPGPVHVHGLGVDPADDALYLATHSGLFRVGPDERKASRVGDRLQDTMGFTVAGPNRFLGSGHPDLKEASERNLPPLLGLIESTDAGGSWASVSLLGEADFHVLRFAGDRVYGYDATGDRLLASADRGESWTELERPAAVVDLAPHPGRAPTLVLTAADGLYRSRSGGSWSRLGPEVGLLAWPASDRLFLVDGLGRTFVSADSGRRFDARGRIGGEPAALLAQSREELFVALHDGTIKRSTDGGATWAVRSTPDAR